MSACAMLYIDQVVCATHFTCNPTRSRHRKSGTWLLLKSAAVCVFLETAELPQFGFSEKQSDFKSILVSIHTHTVLLFFTCLSCMMMSMCERLLLAFRCVAAVVRVRVPCSISCSICTALSHATLRRPST